MLILGIIAAVAFVAMVFIHGKLSEELEYKKAKSEVLRRYIERFGDGWKKFEDNGAQYLGDDDLVARDMDLLGQSSLYQFICVAGTEEGKRALAESIRDPKYDIADIEKRQEAIKELTSKREFSTGEVQSARHDACVICLFHAGSDFQKGKWLRLCQHDVYRKSPKRNGESVGIPQGQRAWGTQKGHALLWNHHHIRTWRRSWRRVHAASGVQVDLDIQCTSYGGTSHDV